LPNPTTQRYIGMIATIGVLLSCFGCGLAANNQINAATAFLVLAWLILVPIFGYLISVRRRTKRVVRKQDEQRKQELDALANIGSVMGDEGTRGSAIRD
jgi:phosphate/sulfate permease